MKSFVLLKNKDGFLPIKRTFNHVAVGLLLDWLVDRKSTLVISSKSNHVFCDSTSLRAQGSSLSLAGAATSIMFVTTKVLSRQTVWWFPCQSVFVRTNCLRVRRQQTMKH